MIPTNQDLSRSEIRLARISTKQKTITAASKVGTVVSKSDPITKGFWCRMRGSTRVRGWAITG
jgi:hypothetical protein